jgi:hypothetical protein
MKSVAVDGGGKGWQDDQHLPGATIADVLGSASIPAG